ncbi:hypothetical protein [Microvirga sp. Mcv34]|uniref:hypothetical protein n=1 Tax=Microvirga sp. Mcv34 TaxID=2926016 RepID=UPI0021CAE2E4|nr:hypothetical protein [Microvirga sp. Mcv34]
MTEFTPDALDPLPGELPRQHIARLRKYLVALLHTLAEDDDARTPLQAALDEVEAILADAAHRAAGRLQAALVARMQDTAAETVAPADSFEQVVQGLDAPPHDALDRLIPSDPEERAALKAFTEELIGDATPAQSQDATPAEAPAVKAPPPKLRPNVPARRTADAGQQGSRKTEDRAAKPAAPAPRAPLARGPGARPAGNAVAAAARQPASAPPAGRPGAASSLSGLKKASGQNERAEGPVEAAPGRPQREPYKPGPDPQKGRMHPDGCYETANTMRLPCGKVIVKPPPMEPGDSEIPW